MSVRVRLTRVGSKKNPIWRVVVADQRSPRDGRFIETIGHYNPQTQPSTIVIDRERLDHWIEQGAQPTNTVRKLMRSPNSAAQGGADGEEPAQVGGPAEATQAEDEGELAAAEQGDGPADGAAAPAEPPADAEASSGQEPAPPGGGAE